MVRYGRYGRRQSSTLEPGYDQSLPIITTNQSIQMTWYCDPLRNYIFPPDRAFCLMNCLIWVACVIKCARHVCVSSRRCVSKRAEGRCRLRRARRGVNSGLFVLLLWLLLHPQSSDKEKVDQLQEELLRTQVFILFNPVMHSTTTNNKTIH